MVIWVQNVTEELFLDSLLKNKKATVFSKYVSRESCILTELKDTHREKGPLNETPALTEGINMKIWVVGTSNQLFIRDC